MSCVIKICYKDYCIVFQFFAQSKFAKSIGYDGNVNSIDLTGLSAEPEFKAGAPSEEVPSTAQLATEIGVASDRFTSGFQIDYDSSMKAYVFQDASAVKSWFINVSDQTGGLSDASGALSFEGFDKYPYVTGFVIKNNGTVIANVSR